MAAQPQVTILDGSIGHLLKQRKVQTSAAGTEWATSFLVPALANVDAPNAVQQASKPPVCRHHQVRYCCWHEMQHILQQGPGRLVCLGT